MQEKGGGGDARGDGGLQPLHLLFVCVRAACNVVPRSMIQASTGQLVQPGSKHSPCVARAAWVAVRLGSPPPHATTTRAASAQTPAPSPAAPPPSQPPPPTAAAPTDALPTALVLPAAASSDAAAAHGVGRKGYATPPPAPPSPPAPLVAAPAPGRRGVASLLAWLRCECVCLCLCVCLGS